jgi:hypothetical protein
LFSGTFGHATLADFAANIGGASHDRCQSTSAKTVSNFDKAPSTVAEMLCWLGQSKLRSKSWVG